LSDQVVLATLSGAGTTQLRQTRPFDAVVIDEAAQAVEPSTLIPLRVLSAPRFVLVGDPQQLPATVISRDAAALMLTRSLFQRLQEAQVGATMLALQYRMHPAIRAFPSKHFYHDQLQD
ncbi:AAA domain-containing protein, partial [Baffinella frigidus]